MAPIFKTSSGLPLAVYIEPSSSNRPALLKSILSNGGAPASRIDKANVILVDPETRKGRKCGREQLASDPERIVLFVQWIDACLSAHKLLGEDLDWGHLRIQDPEILDESNYEEEGNDSQAYGAHRVKEEDHVDSKDHRPWPTPMSPTRPVQGELPVSSGVLPVTTDTKTEIFNYPDSLEPSPGPRLSGSLSPLKSSKASSPIVLTYGQLPTEPEYGSLFLSACEEWENLKREAEAYVPPPKRKSQSYDRHASWERPATKSPRNHLSQERPSRSHPSPDSSQPLAKKRRPPLPAGSTKRGPKQRESYTLDDDFTSSHAPPPQSPTQTLDLELADDSDDVLEIPPPHSQLASTSRSSDKLFTYVDEPMQFSLQTDLPNRVAVIRLLRKHGGTTASKMEDASYVIVSKSMPQYQETVEEAGKVDRIAIPVAWVNRCIEENRIVSTEGYAVNCSSVVGTLMEEEIIKAAMADHPPAPAPSSSWVKSHDRGYKFTQFDQEYLQKTLAWTYARDSTFSLSQFFHYLAKNSPNHSANSWSYFYYRPTADANRVLSIVDDLKS
ncbi:hypothetical protein RSOLAG22IIIB_02524 [Rhizoctonia solani]|uniref:BRCT domain-containing protein n=1 Tax=Rhizoctonia solani TaxID=456999 RepID=A0A0K6GGM9_9AGAM|nr:hypothetical protein RSOLAG22IIIB_02524 [Rhizoctonia solani]